MRRGSPKHKSKGEGGKRFTEEEKEGREEYGVTYERRKKERYTRTTGNEKKEKRKDKGRKRSWRRKKRKGRRGKEEKERTIEIEIRAVREAIVISE